MDHKSQLHYGIVYFNMLTDDNTTKYLVIQQFLRLVQNCFVKCVD